MPGKSAVKLAKTKANGMHRSLKIGSKLPKHSKDCDTQTDDFHQALAEDIAKLDSLKKGTEDSAVSARDPNVLLCQQRTSLRLIEKLAADNKFSKQENERIVSFMNEIFRLVRAMRSEYDSTLVNVKVDLQNLRYDYSRYITEVDEHLKKQKKVLEEERKRYKNALKKKEHFIEDLRTRLSDANEQTRATMQALEIQQRLVTLAQRDVHNANEEVKDVNKKLNDQLFLSGNQKCKSCQVNEKVRLMLSNEVAEKQLVVDTMREKFMEVHADLQQQKRVNEILSRTVDKHSFAEKAIKFEFDKIRLECESLKAQNKLLREQKKIDEAHLTAASLTPPDSSASDKSTKDDSSGSVRSTPNATESPASYPLSIQQSSLSKKNRKNKIYGALPQSSTQVHSPVISDSTKLAGNSATIIPAGQHNNSGPPIQRTRSKSPLMPPMVKVSGALSEAAANSSQDLAKSNPETIEVTDICSVNCAEGIAPISSTKGAQKRPPEVPSNVSPKKKKANQKQIVSTSANNNKIHEKPSGITQGDKPACEKLVAPWHHKLESKPKREPFSRHEAYMDYELDDRSMASEERRIHEAKMREMQAMERRRRASMENEMMLNAISRNAVSSAMNDFTETPDADNLCPTPPPFLRDFRRCNGATLDDFIPNREHLLGESARRQRSAEEPPLGGGPRMMEVHTMRPMPPHNPPREMLGRSRTPPYFIREPLARTRTPPPRHTEAPLLRSFQSPPRRPYHNEYPHAPQMADLGDWRRPPVPNLPPRPPPFMPRPPEPPISRGPHSYIMHDIRPSPMSRPVPSWHTVPIPPPPTHLLDPVRQQNTSWVQAGHHFRR